MSRRIRFQRARVAGGLRFPLLLPPVGLGVLAAALLSCAGAGCRPTTRTGGNDEVSVEVGQPGMNVLFVSVDTTRADSLGCYGHPIVKTPHVDRLAAEGTRFAQCISSAPLTLPTHATMMTGSYPFVHGARDNGAFVLGPENVTLAEIFKQAGYATHAEVAALVLNRQYGLSQGFDTYGDLYGRETVAVRARAAPKVLPGDEAAASRPGEEDTGESEPPSPWLLADRKADEITRRGVELLTRLAGGGRPFFVFLHYFDPHQGYAAPERFAKVYADGYLAEIAFFDEQFGKLMDAVRSLGLSEKTLVILTSDHGEGRGQHGEQTHSYFVYDATLHVPLILWCPGRIPAGKGVAPQVRLIDLAPTIVDFVRLPPTPQMQGTSLLPLLVSAPEAGSSPGYGETMATEVTFGYSPLRCLRDDGWKYILAPEPELYHVAEDPLEMFNLVQAEPERASMMREQLRDLIAASPPPPGQRAARRAVNEEELRKLQALGYLAGGSGSGAQGDADVGSEIDHFEPQGPNPRDRMEPIELMNVSLGALLSEKFEEAEKLCRRLLTLEPNNVMAMRQLIDALASQGRFEESEEQCRKAITVHPNDAPVRVNFAKLLALRNDLAGTEEQLRRAMELDPTSHIVHMHLANVLQRLNRPDDALVEYEAAARLAPDVPTIRLGWAGALRAKGHLPEAEAKLREALRMEAGFAGARFALARLMLDEGRSEEAVAELLALLDAHPEHVRAMLALATHYSQQGDRESAAKYFAKAADTEPAGAMSHFHRGLGLAMQRKMEEAIEQYRKVLKIEPDHAGALLELAQWLDRTGRAGEADDTYRRLLNQKPAGPLAYALAANFLDRHGEPRRATEVLRQGRQMLPDNPDIANDLAWRLSTSSDATVRNGEEAVRFAEQAETLTHGQDIHVLDTLAAAYAECGRFRDAIAAADRAIELARNRGDQVAEDRIQSRRDLYEKNQPYREPAASVP